jgi:hypothetical protein
MSFRLIASPILLLCLVAAACGGGGGGTSQPENASGLESAARSFGNALFSGEAGDAYEFLSAECKEGITEEEFEAAVAFVGIFLALFEAELGDIEVDDVETRNIGDGRGEAMVTMRGPEELGDSFNEDAEFEEWVYEDGGWRIVECDDFEGFEDGDGGDDDEPAFEGPGSSRNEPAPLGTTVEFSGWQVTVDEVNLDAADSIVSEDSFIEEPEAGDVYVLITLTATYVGDGENESQSFFFAFTAGAVGESAVAYEQFSDGCTFFDLPNQLDASRDLFEGGSISGDICLSVTEDDADSLLLYLETFGFSGSTRAWFDLR